MPLGRSPVPIASSWRGLLAAGSCRERPARSGARGPLERAGDCDRHRGPRVLGRAVSARAVAEGEHGAGDRGDRRNGRHRALDRPSLRSEQGHRVGRNPIKLARLDADVKIALDADAGPSSPAPTSCSKPPPLPPPAVSCRNAAGISTRRSGSPCCRSRSPCAPSTRRPPCDASSSRASRHGHLRPPPSTPHSSPTGTPPPPPPSSRRQLASTQRSS